MKNALRKLYTFVIIASINVSGNIYVRPADILFAQNYLEHRRNMQHISPPHFQRNTTTERNIDTEDMDEKCGSCYSFL